MKRKSIATTIVSMFLAVSQIAGMGLGRGLRADVGTNETAGMQTGSGDSIIGLESITPIAAPTGVKAEKPANSDTRVVISWDAVENAAGYQVWRATSSKDTYIALESVTATSRLCVGLTGGTTYYFKVRAYKEIEGKRTYSDFSDDVIWIAPTPGEDTPDIGAPSGVTAEVSGSSVMLSWNAVSDVTGYQVYRADAETGRYYACGTVTTTGRRCPGLQVGSTYSFKIRAYKEENGTCVYGDFSSPVTVDILEISVPRNVKAIGKTTDSIELTWDKADSAEGYEIWIPKYSNTTRDQDFVLFQSTTECNATIDKNGDGYRLEPSQYPYYLRVRAYGTVNGKKVYSDFVQLKGYTKPNPPSGISIERRHNSDGHPEAITIKWRTYYNKNSDNNREIWVATSIDGPYELLTDNVHIISVSGVYWYSFTQYPTELGNTYYYKVRCSFAGNMSDFSKVQTIAPSGGIPQNIRVTRDPYNTDNVLVSWDAVPGTSLYTISLKDDSEPRENIYVWLSNTSTKSTSLVIESKYFKSPSTYSVSVRADGPWDRNELVQGKYSDPVSFLPADLPIPSIPIDETTFPDEKFREYILDNIDTGEKDGALSYEERTSVRVIDVKNMGISSLEGLDYFENLEELDCSNNSLEELRSYKTKKMKKVNCSKNHLTSLTFRNSKALEVIDCSDNNLNSTPYNASLKSLIAINNNIFKSDLRGISVLTQACETYGMELVDDGKHYICRDASTVYVYLDKTAIVLPKYFEPDIEGPTGVKIENPWDHASKVRFSWDACPNYCEYEVWRAEGSTGKYYLCGAVTTKNSKVDCFRDCPGLTKSGVTYFFKVRAYWKVKYDLSLTDNPENYVKVYSNFSSAVGWTAPINETSAEIGVPANVRSEQIAETRAMISWDAVSDITGYEVWRATDASGKYDLCGTVTDTRRECIGLGIGKTFYFKVRSYKAVDGGRVYSEFSSVINVKTEYEKVLPAPSGVNAVRKGYSIFTVLVIWKEVAGADGYQVWRANGDSSEFYALDSSTIHGTQRLCQGSWTRGETYKFKVRAYKIVDGKKHYGEFSSVVSATIPN